VDMATAGPTETLVAPSHIVAMPRDGSDGSRVGGISNDIADRPDPRAREIVWIMLAQRAARGLGSLYAQANIFTMKEARDFHVAMTPRGWMRDDLDLLGFEQLLYLRQPGYGTSYITGKYLIERLLGEMGRLKGEEMSLAEFFAAVDEQGVIPVSLIHWQLTGSDSQIRDLNQ
jgi:hypothetical protein